jgi:hypothetical protein
MRPLAAFRLRPVSLEKNGLASSAADPGPTFEKNPDPDTALRKIVFQQELFATKMA